MGDKDHMDDPRTYDEVISDIDSEKWLNAMKSEMDSMHTNHVWTLVNPLEGIIPIGCKWIYKRKIGVDGKVETYKAWLVSPVAMLKSISTLLATIAFHDDEIWQTDVKMAFLKRYLE